ncbi:hypothetical protein IP69_14650 [Bosea sp. AAP35]|nr:hypothetical protein IP69_14650 [Bosea sp. AAP35]
MSYGAASAQPVLRDVVVIFDSEREPRNSQTQVHMRVEFPLNHLGYRLVYRDIRQGLPDAATMATAAAVLTWLQYELDDHIEYLAWLNEMSDQGIKVIILGSLGVPFVPETVRLANRIFAKMGLRFTGEFVSSVLDAKVASLDRDLMEFERALDPVPNEHALVERVGSGARIGLEYTLRFEGRERRSIVAAVGPAGGYVAHGYIVHGDATTGAARWIVNPLSFFKAALGSALFPIPDTTTVSGRRLYFSHVDGDAWNNGVQIDGYRPRRGTATPAAGSAVPGRTMYSSDIDGDAWNNVVQNGRTGEQVTASQMMLRELIEPYPDLPVTVGLVAEDTDQELGGGQRAMETARRVFALPQVEVASHTCTHPFNWDFFANYSRAAEYDLIVENQRQTKNFTTRLMEAIGFVNAAEARRTRYLVGGNHAPRAFLRDPFSIDREVTHALQITQALAPEGKRAALYLWSGNTRPFEGIIKATRQAGVRNMNGGDTRFDAQHPSLAYVAPLSRVVGGERQIYAVNSNENTYTNLWTAHFHGFRQLRETLERTELPRRLKGVNVYYHTYSAERRASLEAVRFHLDWAREAKLAPIKASEYAAIADGFFSASIAQTGELSWTISTRDGLQTLRLDQPGHLVPDLAASIGILGTNSHAGSLYIALDASAGIATLVLKRRSAVERSSFAVASLRESRWQLRHMRREACGLQFVAEGFGNGEFVFDHLPQGPLTITASRHGHVLETVRSQADTHGSLNFSLALRAFEPVDVEIRCGVKS